MDALLPLAAKYDAEFIGLLWGPEGMPRDENERGALCAELVYKATSEFGISPERILIDPIQTPVNVQQIDCDFFIFSGHKIFAPTGVGVVYAKEELLEIMPPWQGGGNMIRNVTFEETTYNEPPAKFEAGTPSIADAVGLGAALDYVNRLGLANTGKYEQELLQYATEQLSLINGVRLIGTAREKVAVISFVLQDRRTEEVGRLLDIEGIAVRAGHHCCQPLMRVFDVNATTRASVYFYNTIEEIDTLARGIERVRKVFGV